MGQFLQTIRQTTRRLGLAEATEHAYIRWIKRYILYHQQQSQEEMTRTLRQ